MSNNSTQNNGPSSAQSFWDAAWITWEKGGTDRPVDLQNLGLIFPDEAAFENTIEVDWDPLPDAILHMMLNSLYISLAFLTTSALDCIQLNQNVKYRKIPFGHGVGKITIDETSFPLEESLAETDFWQASKNWLILVETLAGPAITEGWCAHHQKMFSDRHFSQWYPAWRAHDKLLRVRFMTRPFIIDPKGLIYAQQFECCRTDLALLGDPCALSTASTSTNSLNDRHPISRPGDVNFRSTGSSSMSSSRYVPYDKENRQNSSFHPSETTMLCCQDTDFSEKYELGLEEKSLRTFPRIR